MNLFIIGAGCSKSYDGSYSKLRMPIAKDFFKTYNNMENLNTSRWVLVGSIINALNILKNTTPFDPFKDDFDIEEIHSLFEKKLFEAIANNNDDEVRLYFKAYTELVFLFSCVVNEISNGPTSEAHINLVKKIKNTDSIITFNWDTLLDRALFENKNWNSCNGYYVKPKDVFSDGWKVATDDPNFKGPYLLKMHGSANWLTGAICMNPGDSQFSMIQEVSPDTFYTFENANGPYDCWDGRWEKTYEAFSYGYYPPNLPLQGKKLEKDMMLVRMIMRGPMSAPKGSAGNGGLVSMPLIIPPVKNKVYNFYGKLFDDIWNKAEQEITKAECLIFIGYSFPITDLKTISLFKSAFIKRKSIPKVFIIDPFPERIIDLMKMEFGIPEDKITVFKDYFSKDFDLSFLK